MKSLGDFRESERDSLRTTNDPERGYLARQLVQCTLPHKNPGDIPAYTRKDGQFTLIVQPGYNEKGESLGIPYGIIPRLLMLWISSEVVRTRSRELRLGNSFNDFLRKVGLEHRGRGKRSDAKRVVEQATKLFSSRFTFWYAEGDDEKGSSAFKNVEVSAEGQYWWDYKFPEQGSFFESYIILGEKFYDAILAAPVPFDFKAVRALKRSPLAFDLYCWICWRTNRMQEGQVVTIGWNQIHNQLGADYKAIRQFRAHLKEAMIKVEAVHPGLVYDITPRGLALHGLSPAKQPIKPALRAARLSVERTRKDPWDLTAHELISLSEISKGWDARALRKEWEQWCKAKGIVPKNSMAHFTDFIKRHIDTNGTGLG